MILSTLPFASPIMSQSTAALNVVLWTFFYMGPFAVALFSHTRRLVVRSMHAKSKSRCASIWLIVLTLALGASVVTGIAIALLYNHITALAAAAGSGGMRPEWEALISLALITPIAEWLFVLLATPDSRQRAFDLIGLLLAICSSIVVFIFATLLYVDEVVNNYVAPGMTIPLPAVLIFILTIRVYELLTQEAVAAAMRKNANRV